MKYVRYEHQGKTAYGILSGEQIEELSGNFIGAEPSKTGSTVALSDVKLLYPVEAPKVLCVGLNYQSHLNGRPTPAKPEIFYKPPTALQNPGDPIELPSDSKDVHFEAELVVVMGKTAKNVSAADAAGYIFGYTCGNDVSERNWQNGSQGDKPDVQWWRAKGSDTFGPLGPAVETELDVPNKRITCRLNGEVKQTQMLSDLIFPPAKIIEFVTQFITLEPGDVIYTGTPGRTSPMKAGDKVEVEIEGIGVLENPVAAG
ncbi:MAG: DUF2437 domain-containing protein [Acidobacteria bacterium]|nr:DUF2437 domain-containing protein [Acidobacteriota bacterium]